MQPIQNVSDFNTRAEVMKALAHPARLFIVDELSRGERCVQELTGMVGMDMSTVSRHLQTLRNAGIVEGEQRGKQIFYTLKVTCVLNFFHCLTSVLEQR